MLRRLLARAALTVQWTGFWDKTSRIRSGAFAATGLIWRLSLSPANGSETCPFSLRANSVFHKSVFRKPDPRSRPAGCLHLLADRAERSWGPGDMVHLSANITFITRGVVHVLLDPGRTVVFTSDAPRVGLELPDWLLQGFTNAAGELRFSVNVNFHSATTRWLTSSLHVEAECGSGDAADGIPGIRVAALQPLNRSQYTWHDQYVATDPAEMLTAMVLGRLMDCHKANFTEAMKKLTRCDCWGQLTAAAGASATSAQGLCQRSMRAIRHYEGGLLAGDYDEVDGDMDMAPDPTYEEPVFPDEDADSCLVCLERPRRFGFLHGGSVHRAVCEECAAVLRRRPGGPMDCVLCRKRVERVIECFG
ncbi:hypothetical protein GPECTOR_29g52 [Gonium pectorale]|uniref:RING-type domain-containing protein n=1 Tax=Gonium pectorale TaxID=33097 RepID=A0A150GFC1_GONPE|nr:hypothetical protein GPECTOR_29g52 [Gonium pectorale]|eukprot:KXZ48275.1 hypothetical protein GPECTOR_29g52 [Gonium pectorale]